MTITDISSNFTRSDLDKFPKEKIEAIIHHELTGKDIMTIDLRLLGNVVLHKAISLSCAVNSTLLSPMSHWIDDPGWMKRFAVINDPPDWASYKRKSRAHIKRLKQLASERLGKYWQEIRKKRNYRSELRKIYSKQDYSDDERVEIKNDFLSPIVSTFSPLAIHNTTVRKKFIQSLSRSMASRIPWRPILVTEILANSDFSKLRNYCPKNTKQDIACKLIHLLEMDMEGKISISQEEPFGEIKIDFHDQHIPTTLTVMDTHGRSYKFDWLDLNQKQRDKIITDLLNNHVLYHPT